MQVFPKFPFLYLSVFLLLCSFRIRDFRSANLFYHIVIVLSTFSFLIRIVCMKYFANICLLLYDLPTDSCVNCQYMWKPCAYYFLNWRFSTKTEPKFCYRAVTKSKRLYTVAQPFLVFRGYRCGIFWGLRCRCGFRTAQRFRRRSRNSEESAERSLRRPFRAP